LWRLSVSLIVYPMMVLRVWLLVAAVVDKGGETGDADAKRTEPEVV
jgi:hypothetical protein